MRAKSKHISHCTQSLYPSPSINSWPILEFEVAKSMLSTRACGDSALNVYRRFSYREEGSIKCARSPNISATAPNHFTPRPLLMLCRLWNLKWQNLSEALNKGLR